MQATDQATGNGEPDNCLLLADEAKPRPASDHRPSTGSASPPKQPGRQGADPRRWRIAVQLVALLRPFRGSLALLLALSLGAVMIEVVPPLLQGYLVDHVLTPGVASNPQAQLLVLLAAIVAGLLLVRLAATFLGAWKGRVSSIVGTSMTSTVSQEDPCPQIPPAFVDPRRMRKISREIKGFCLSDEEESAHSEAVSQQRPGQPEVLVRSVVATRQDVHVFGRMLAVAAWQRGFAAAQRNAFVADGQDANWTVWRDYFCLYTPILDFVHAICYVFAAAMAGRHLREGWPVYCQWAQWIWSGQVQRVIVALQARQQELGLPEKAESAETPRSKVAEALRYLENQKSRMHYDQYRRQGLPITSSHIESTIKQINRRVKGTEKFWSEGGAEALLQLGADYMSDTDPMTTFWKDRPNQATGQRQYQTSG